MSFDFKALPSHPGKIAIVTGANIGLGFETTVALASKKIKVIMACRSRDKAEEAMKKIKSKIYDANLEIMIIDLGSLESVRHFASEFSAKYQQLDLLINNAGLMVPPFSKTKEGFESQFGVNYLAHFLLSALLFPILNQTERSRIISLSSIAHTRGKIDFENLQREKKYSKWVSYSQSKLACLMFALELQRRLESIGSKTASVAAHPGVSNTNLWQHMPKRLFSVLSKLMSFVTHEPDQAVLPILKAALDPEIKGGDYIGPTGFREMKGPPGKARIARQATDVKTAARLWELSEKLVGEQFRVTKD